MGLPLSYLTFEFKLLTQFKMTRHHEYFAMMSGWQTNLPWIISLAEQADKGGTKIFIYVSWLGSKEKGDLKFHELNKRKGMVQASQVEQVAEKMIIAPVALQRWAILQPRYRADYNDYNDYSDYSVYTD